MKIIDPLDATQAKDTTRYNVSCLKCGAHAEMTHRQLLERARKRVEACGKCRAHKGMPRVDNEIEGVRDLRGGFWPKLKGPMDRDGGSVTGRILGSGKGRARR